MDKATSATRARWLVLGTSKRPQPSLTLAVCADISANFALPFQANSEQMKMSEP